MLARVVAKSAVPLPVAFGYLILISIWIQASYCHLQQSLTTLDEFKTKIIDVLKEDTFLMCRRE